MANVLVVDDEAAIAQLLEGYLAACGHSVVSARSSLGSLGWLDKEPFDVVVLDIVMEGRMNGLDVCRILKSDPRTAGTAVLVISALEYLGGDALAAGADAFLSKPFGLETIRDAIVDLARTGPTNYPLCAGASVREAIGSYSLTS
jgi:CheY-like chemotaxis protein